MVVEIFLELVKSIGLPAAMIVVMGVYHAGVVKAKDAEIARVNGIKDAELSRVNELRVKESQEVSDKLIGRDAKYIEVMGEMDKTLTLVAQRIK
jgi:hypothetical protein